MFLTHRGLHKERRFARRLWALGLIFAVVWVSARFLKYSETQDQPWIIGWDQMGYYVWAHSIAIDGDLDFSNQYAFASKLRGYGERAERLRQWHAELPVTPRDRTAHFFPAGTGLMSLPLLFFARFIVSWHERILGVQVSSFAAVYPLAHLITQTMLAFIGLAAAWFLLRPHYGTRIATAAVAVVFLSTPLAYYTILSPGYAHPAGFCMNTLFLWAAVAWQRRWHRAIAGTGALKHAVASAFGMGALLGLSSMIRNTNIHLAMAPFVLAVIQARQAKHFHQGRALRYGLLSLAAATFGFLLGFLPQMLAWKALWGSWIVYSYAGHDMHKIHGYPIHFYQVLFGTRIGLFWWHPLTGLSIAGLAMAAYRRRAFAWAGLAALFMTAWIYGSWKWYWLGYAFGMRAFVDFSVFFMAGIAEILLRCKLWTRRLPRRVYGIRTLILALVVWNLYLAAAYRAGLQPTGQPWAGRRLVTGWSRDRAQQLWRDIPIIPEVVYNMRKARIRRMAEPDKIIEESFRRSPVLFPLFTIADHDPD